jgi:hypothetical protein
MEADDGGHLTSDFPSLRGREIFAPAKDPDPGTDVMAVLKKLKIAIKTSSDQFAGTDATIYLVLAVGDGGRIYRLPTHKSELEAGKTDIYKVSLTDGPELGAIRTMMLVNGMDGQSPGWKILWVKIDVVDSDGHAWKLVDAMLQRWLDVKDNLAPTAFLPLLHPFEDLGLDDPVGATEVSVTGL